MLAVASSSGSQDAGPVLSDPVLSDPVPSGASANSPASSAPSSTMRCFAVTSCSALSDSGSTSSTDAPECSTM
jgi:hypothetical protein